MIPKVIHYCWFGKGKLPESAELCIRSWKKYCPDYEIKRWDESNFDINCSKFVSQAYDSRKYAFVADYARFEILKKNGGIYVDTDVELIKPIDEFLNDKAFMGFEKASGKVTGVAPGLIMASEPNAEFLSDILNIYKNMEFYNENKERIAKSVVEYTTSYLEQYGLKKDDLKQVIRDVVIYPSDYFCPKDFETGKTNITDETVSIHHYDSTWWSKRVLMYKKLTSKYGEKKGKILYRIVRIVTPGLWTDK